MQKKLAAAATLVRIVTGLIFVTFGLNGFFHFIPMPPPDPRAAVFMGALAMSGYFFPLLKTVEILCGLALLGNKFVPLAMIILSPIVINILAFHVFLDVTGLPLAIFLVLAFLFLSHMNRQKFLPLMKP